jgi:hypothetical protein
MRQTTRRALEYVVNLPQSPGNYLDIVFFVYKINAVGYSSMVFTSIKTMFRKSEKCGGRFPYIILLG